MQVYLQEDSFYPYYKMFSGYMTIGIPAEIDEELYEEYLKIRKQFFDMQLKLRDLYKEKKVACYKK